MPYGAGGKGPRDPDQDRNAGPIKDFEFEGKQIPASRLGYRITRKFVRQYLGRVFDNPSKVFTEDILKPELQDLPSFADGILHIAEAQKRVSMNYMQDGGYENACPPLKAVLDIMAYGNHEGKQITDPEIRRLFSREELLKSEWYRRRLVAKQLRDIEHWKTMERKVRNYLDDPTEQDIVRDLNIEERLNYVQDQLSKTQSPDYQEALIGTLGVDPMQPTNRE